MINARIVYYTGILIFCEMIPTDRNRLPRETAEIAKEVTAMGKSSTWFEQLIRALSIFLVCLLLVAFIVNLDRGGTVVRLEPDTAQRVTEGWFCTVDGETKPVTLPLEVPVGAEGSVAFTRQCSAEEMARGMLAVSNERQNIAVEINGEEVFRMDGEGENLPTSVYEYCLVELPQVEEAAELTITFTHCRGDICLFSELYLCTPAEVLANMIYKDGLQITVLILCLALTLFAGFTSIWLMVKKQDNRRFISVFLLMTAVSLWNITNMWSSPLLRLSYQMLNWISYTSLMLLPIPVGLFAFFSTVNHRSRIVKVSIVLAVLTAVVQQALYLYGVCTLFDMVIWSHLVLGVISLSCVSAQIHDNRKGPNTHGKFLIAIFSVPVLLVASSIPMFWLMEGQLYSDVFQIGMLFFITLLLGDATMAVVAQQIDMKKTEAELSMLQTLSFKDGLTGMGNRRAFDDHVEQIEKKSLDNALLVFMDVNALKITNDRFGHAAGDELIVSTSKCILSVFGREGACYRLGGDEFAAVIENPSLTNEKYNFLLNEAIKRFNEGRPTPLSIARGFERLINQDGIRRTSSLWKSNADREMYADKMRSKMLLTKEDVSLVVPEHIDEMSGILNTQGFRQNAVRLICQYPEKQYSLWYYNIKRFKFVNDFFGYEVGDKLIKYISSLLLESIHEGEICGRISADCFVSLQQLGEEADIKAHFHYVASSLNRFLKISRISYQLEMSVGIYCLKPEDMKAPDINQMIDWANVAQKSVKDMSGSQYTLFGEEMWQRQWRDLYINQTLDAALKNGDITVWFQPQYDYMTGRIIGAEALCRWMHESLGWLAPAEFIAALEHTGQIGLLDAYVREEACRLMQRWRSSKTMEEVSVSVNISRNSVLENNYIDELDALLERYQLPRSALRLEITESAYMNHPEMLVDAVDLLHKHGYTVEMDDFGSGFSSLNMLKDVPVDLLKLDIRFLQGGSQRSKGAQIVNAVVRMARELKIPVLTEGVENKEQAQYLTNIGCPLMQGYFFSKPLPVNEFEQLLRKEKERSHKEAEKQMGRPWYAPLDATAKGEVYDVVCADYQINSLGEVVMCDEDFTRITGYTWDDVVNSHLTQIDLLPEEDREAYRAMLTKKLAEQTVLCLKHRIRRRDGRDLMVHCLGVPAVDEYTGESRSTVHLQCERKELTLAEE